MTRKILQFCATLTGFRQYLLWYFATITFSVVVLIQIWSVMHSSQVPLKTPQKEIKVHVYVDIPGFSVSWSRWLTPTQVPKGHDSREAFFELACSSISNESSCKTFHNYDKFDLYDNQPAALGNTFPYMNGFAWSRLVLAQRQKSNSEMKGLKCYSWTVHYAFWIYNFG